MRPLAVFDASSDAGKTTHGGNIYRFANQIGCLPEQIIDFSSNINPEQAVNPNQILLTNLKPYAEPEYTLLKKALQQRYPLPANGDIEVFNGASAAIFALLKHLQPKDLVLYTPLYGEYSKIAKLLDCTSHNIDRFTALTAAVPEHSTVIFVNPATPDGTLYDLQTLLKQWQTANCTIIIDESFIDFCGTNSVVDALAQYDKLFIIKSLTKFYGCAGVRIGFIAGEQQAINKLRALEPAWKLSSFDMAYMQEALANTNYIQQTQQLTRQRRELLYNVLVESKLFERIYPSQAIFLLAQLAKPLDGYELQERLAASRLLIRICDDFVGLSNRHIRLAVKDETAIGALAIALKTIQP